MYDYNARYYDPYLNRFIQADTIVPSPQNPQSLNRYSYVLNSPLRYTDPTGHFTQEEIMKYLGLNSWEEVEKYFASMIDVLHMLQEQFVTWGSVLVAGNDGKATFNAVFLLLGRAGSDRYRLTLWDLDKGGAIAFSCLSQYERWEVFNDSGSGFARVYGNHPGADTVFSPPSPTASGIRIPTPDGYQVGRWQDWNASRLGKSAALFTAATLLHSVPGQVGAIIDAVYGYANGEFFKEFPYIQAPYIGIFGTMYDEYGVPHSVSPLTVSFQGPLGPARIIQGKK